MVTFLSAGRKEASAGVGDYYKSGFIQTFHKGLFACQVAMFNKV